MWLFSQKYWQDISRGGIFHDTTPISFIKVYGLYFRVGVIFAKKTNARKNMKISTFTVHVVSREQLISQHFLSERLTTLPPGVTLGVRLTGFYRRVACDTWTSIV